MPDRKEQSQLSFVNSKNKREKSIIGRRPESEAHYRVMKMFAANPNLSQRQIAAELGISVGKANYCIKALTDRGWVKARNFRNSDNKLAYAYILTPSGIRRKAQLTVRFLEHRRREFEELKREIEMLSAEIEGVPVDGSDER